MLSCKFLVLLSTPFLLLASVLHAAEKNGGTEIRYNQVGYLPKSHKTMVVPSTEAKRFHLLDAKSKEKVYTAPLSDEQVWPLSGEKIKIADFSGFAFAGKYQLQVDGLKDSPQITITSKAYRKILEASIKSFYLNRASVPLEEDYAGIYKRPAGHPDTIVFVHESAATDERPIGTPLSSSKGWYDAGDYNKYIVNSANAVSLLMMAYNDYEHVFKRMSLNIPESTNQYPDILDEVKWNLDWMETMQDPNDGGVYHKLSTLRFSAAEMPHTQYQRRFLLPKSTEASLTYAAAMAVASRTFAKFDAELAKRYQFAALKALTWAESNPDQRYVQPEGFNTGQYSYSEDDFKDEWLWAYSEIYRLTGKKKYAKNLVWPEVFYAPKWNRTELLALFSILENEKASPKAQEAARAHLMTTVQEYVSQNERSEYGVPVVETDLIWGSNSELMNKALVLLKANQIEKKLDFEMAAHSLLDYILGRNPTGYSFVTGFGDKTPMNIHHRVSKADGIENPVPGLLAGGANPGGTDLDDCSADKVKYSTEVPTKAYVDAWCSYATNEVAINWNAVLVYVLTAIQNKPLF